MTAPGAGTPAATTPGRAACEAFGALMVKTVPPWSGDRNGWDDLDDDYHAAWKAAAQAAIEAAAAQPGGMDSLYRERAHLVAHLAAIYPSCIGPAEDVDEPGWAIVCVTTPEGQMTWHIGYRDLDLFGHVHVGSEPWDGHTTAEKYARLDRLTKRNPAERDSLAGRVDGLVSKAGELREERDRLADALAGNPDPLVSALQSQVEHFRELIAEILDALDHGGPYWAEEWRARAGLEG